MSAHEEFGPEAEANASWAMKEIGALHRQIREKDAQIKILGDLLEMFAEKYAPVLNASHARQITEALRIIGR